MQIIQKLIPVGTLRRSGQAIKGVKFIVAHDTGNDNSTAQNNVDYYIKSANEMSASAHVFVDDKGAIWCVPETEKAWHVRYNVPLDNQIFGGDANDYAIGVELCYSTRGAFDSRKAYENYCDLIADLCKKYHLDPHQHIIGHYKLDPTRKTDPINAFSKIGKTWDNFIADVSSRIGGEELVTIQVPKSKLDKVLAYIKSL